MARASFSELFVAGILRHKLQCNERLNQQAEVGRLFTRGKIMFAGSVKIIWKNAHCVTSSETCK